ncbi:hypothetical protein AYO22_08814 [Fonsecaea multimorphosa]|nr:hypothetical protein AYO22_08814 [Fonsecaea multimorphosa]
MVVQGNSNPYSESNDHVLAPPSEQENQTISHSQLLISTPQEPQYSTTTTQEQSEPPIDVFTNQDVGQEDNSLYATDTLNFEYYGPRCMMSFYSQPAVDWVDSKIKTADYSSTVRRLVRESARMLKMSRDALSSCREPEPAAEVAWQYTNGKSSFNVLYC